MGCMWPLETGGWGSPANFGLGVHFLWSSCGESPTPRPAWCFGNRWHLFAWIHLALEPPLQAQLAVKTVCARGIWACDWVTYKSDTALSTAVDCFLLCGPGRPQLLPDTSSSKPILLSPYNPYPPASRWNPLWGQVSLVAQAGLELNNNPPASSCGMLGL